MPLEGSRRSHAKSARVYGPGVGESEFLNNFLRVAQTDGEPAKMHRIHDERLQKMSAPFADQPRHFGLSDNVLFRDEVHFSYRYHAPTKLA
ncbi:hypothetical protein PUN28_012285 [Cardiocondyla obscurior]|uniref:Uncharacterized protein n=1 Tax=Cardiocondyla obscurior TaxID=286306 RepID=A0AAW2FD50_9HYME